MDSLKHDDGISQHIKSLFIITPEEICRHSLGRILHKLPNIINLTLRNLKPIARCNCLNSYKFPQVSIQTLELYSLTNLHERHCNGNESIAHAQATIFDLISMLSVFSSIRTLIVKGGCNFDIRYVPDGDLSFVSRSGVLGSDFDSFLSSPLTKHLRVSELKAHDWSSSAVQAIQLLSSFPIPDSVGPSLTNVHVQMDGFHKVWDFNLWLDGNRRRQEKGGVGINELRMEFITPTACVHPAFVHWSFPSWIDLLKTLRIHKSITSLNAIFHVRPTSDLNVYEILFSLLSTGLSPYLKFLTLTFILTHETNSVTTSLSDLIQLISSWDWEKVRKIFEGSESLRLERLDIRVNANTLNQGISVHRTDNVNDGERIAENNKSEGKERVLIRRECDSREDLDSTTEKVRETIRESLNRLERRSLIVSVGA
ncbi:hypothetical protein ABKN59_004782 [Abortiporus biennis]